MNVKILDTIYPPIQIHIRSDDYKFKFDSNDYLFQIHETIRNVDPNKYYMTASLTSGEFPVSFYNVNLTNNILHLNYENADFSISIPRGNYNLGQLLSKIDLLLTELNFTNKPVLSWSSIDNKISIIFVGDATIKESSSCLSLLGFTKTNHTLIGGGTLTSDSMCDIRGYTNLFFHTDLFSNGYASSTHTDNITHNVLARVACDAGAYSTIIFRPNSPHSVPIQKNAFKVFRISIRDFEGNIIDMNLMMWSATITINYHLIHTQSDDYISKNAFTGTFTKLNNNIDTPHILRQYIDEITKEYKDGNMDYSRISIL